MSWASKLNLEDNWDLCENCQVSEFGGWPNGVVPIKTSAEKTNNTLATQPSLAIAPELIAAPGAKRQKQKQLAIVPAPESFLLPPIPTSSISLFQRWIKTRKILWRN